MTPTLSKAVSEIKEGSTATNSKEDSEAEAARECKDNKADSEAEAARECKEECKVNKEGSNKVEISKEINKSPSFRCQ
jgi:hypothetical protein